MASIRKRGNTFQITVSLGFDTEGKQIVQTTTYRPEARTEKAIEKEVKEYARDFEKKVKAGKYLTGEKTTFQEVTKLWLSDCAADTLTDHGEKYLDRIKKYAYPAFGTAKISSITTIQIQALINSMRESGLAPKTIHYTITAINAVFRYAYRLRIIQENPCTRDRIQLPKLKQDNEIHYFTPDQAIRFLDYMKLPYEKTVKAHTSTGADGKPRMIPEYKEMICVPLQHQLFFTLAIYGGFRRGELGALTWEDVNYKDHTITISKAIARRKGGQVIKDPKTEHGNRTVTLPASCFEMLRHWQTEQLKYRFKLGTAWQGNKDLDKSYIFIQDNGSMIDISSVRKRFLSIVRRYNEQCEKEKREADKLPEIRVHDLRHTCATLLLANDCDIATISQRLGHSKVSVTLDIYSHPLPENDKAAADILERVLSRRIG